MNLPCIRIFLTVLLALTSCLPARKSGQDIDSRRLYNVGFRVMTMEVTEGGVTKDLDVAVWYPTAAQPRLYQYAGPTYGRVTRDAAPLTGFGTFPMLAFSHGYGGCGLASSFFTEELASRGWIVACPDHHDTQNAFSSTSGRNENLDRREFLEGAKDIVNTTPEERGKFMYRPEELEATINGMIASSMFGKLIDITRIAAGGHSFGGFSSMALCGTIPGYQDSRIKALLLFSTGAGAYLMTEEEMARVAIPSMLMMGEKERDQKRGEKTMEVLEQTIFTNMPVPKYFLEIRGATHFSFNIRTSSGIGTRLLSGSDQEFDVIIRYSIAFLEKHVAGNTAYNRVLQHDDPMLTRYIVGE
jgi:predicted dienelactone hydrolase